MSDDRDGRQAGEPALVLRCQIGDEGAFEALFDRYHLRVLYYLRRLIGESLAEDVLQRVWLKVYRKVGTLERPGAFRTWLYRIARNEAMSAVRGSPRRVDLEDERAREELSVEPELGEEDLREADVRALQVALGRLAGHHREVIALRYVEGLAYEEIAEVVDVPVGTVRSRLHYAKRRIREQMETQEESA